MLNLLWLLLPVAFIFGWWGGRRSAGHSTMASPANGNESSYFRGLNYLINEQQDEAMELFLGIKELDQEMADTQLALGNLFRRRGEFDRAIKIHQHLVDRSDAQSSAYGDALLELANDYTASGLLDWAEKAYKELISRKQHVKIAYDALISVFEREKDWQNAIVLAEESAQRQGGGERTVQLGHFYCEMADRAVAERDTDTARQYLKKALSIHPTSARAHILRGDLAMGRDDYDRAIQCYTSVEHQNPELTPEIIKPLLDAYYESGDIAGLRAYIRRIRERLNSYSVIKTTRKMIENLDGEADADSFFKSQLLKRPSLKGLRDWAQGELEKSKPGEKEKVAVIIRMLDSVVEDKPGYVCSKCGFKARALHWQCPSCGSWESIKTVIGVEGE